MAQIFDFIMASISSLWRQKLRTFVAMLSMAAAVLGIIMVAGNTLYIQKMTQNLMTMMADLSLVKIYSPEGISWPESTHPRKKEIQDEDINALRVQKHVKGVAPYVVFRSSIDLGNRAGLSSEESSLHMVGGSPEIFDVLQWEIVEGRNIAPESANFECLVNKEAEKVFFGGDALGQTIRLTGKENVSPRVEIVGIFRSKYSSMGNAGFVSPELAKLLANEKYPSEVTIRLKESGDPNTDAYNLMQARDTLKGVVSQIFGEGTGEQLVKTDADQFLTDLAKRARVQVTATFFLVLGLFISTSIVAELLYVEVHTNIVEIGIRRALGATRLQIAIEVLTQGVIICLAGGLAGIALSYLYYITPQDFQDAFRWQSMAQLNYIALVLCIVAGIFAAITPAYSAAKVNPVDALQEKID